MNFHAVHPTPAPSAAASDVVTPVSRTIDNYLPRGALVTIAALADAGASLVMLDMAVRLASGASWAGRTARPPARVIEGLARVRRELGATLVVHAGPDSDGEVPRAADLHYVVSRRGARIALRAIAVREGVLPPEVVFDVIKTNFGIVPVARSTCSS
jgi:hypothetical protein